MPTDRPARLRPAEVARLLGCAPSTVRRLAAQQQLAALNIGTRKQRYFRVAPGDLAHFIESRLSGAQETP